MTLWHGFDLKREKWRDVSKLWEHQEIPSHSIIDVCRQNGKWILFTEYVSPNNTETKGNLFLKNIWSQCSRSPKSVLLNLQLPPWHFLKIESGFLFYEIQLPNNHKFCEHWIWEMLLFLSCEIRHYFLFLSDRLGMPPRLCHWILSKKGWLDGICQSGEKFHSGANIILMRLCFGQPN